ncbi:MAG: transcriptional repressor [Firmicutes bacterium]|nr:transcriptional repressor [Bacillota bacterium]
MAIRRNTIQKQLIFDAVVGLNIHATAEQVYEYIAKENPSISKATVYRNLAQMAEAGELLNIGVFYGATHYDHNLHRHYHFVCSKCGSVFDIDGDFACTINKIKEDSQHQITDYNISFSGVCYKCKGLKS